MKQIDEINITLKYLKKLEIIILEIKRNCKDDNLKYDLNNILYNLLICRRKLLIEKIKLIDNYLLFNSGLKKKRKIIK